MPFFTEVEVRISGKKLLNNKGLQISKLHECRHLKMLVSLNCL